MGCYFEAAAITLLMLTFRCCSSPAWCEIVASRQARLTGETESPETITGAARKNEDTGDGWSRREDLQSRRPR